MLSPSALRNDPFIGMTMPPVNMLWDACLELSKSEAVRTVFGLPETPESEDALLAVMFQTQLTFVVSHEYTHHVHGHFSHGPPGSAFFNEIISNGDTGNLEDQAFELDADGYAVYHVLAHLITGPRRTQATELLSCNHQPTSTQDELLFSSFVIAVGTFLYVLPPASVELSEIYNRTHPLQAARMNWIMRNAMGWCVQNRPSLADWMTAHRFLMLMNEVAKATWRMNGGKEWREQISFLESDSGTEYSKKLETLVKNHVRSL